MKRLSLSKLVAVAFLATNWAWATPSLQLDIAGGIYHGTGGLDESTTYASANAFTLYALGLNSGNTAISFSENYYVSAALVKLDGSAISSAGGNFGSFKFENTTVQVTSGMTYGVPPLDDPNQTRDPGDLQNHGIFPTYYTQFSFKFIAAQKTTAYNVQTDVSPVAHNTISVGTPTPATTMYFVPFAVDVSLLGAGYGIHFDLYNECIVRSYDYDVNKFAPYSHDATGYHQNYVGVPDVSATAALLGLGLLGLGFMARRKP